MRHTIIGKMKTLNWVALVSLTLWSSPSWAQSKINTSDAPDVGKAVELGVQRSADVVIIVAVEQYERITKVDMAAQTAEDWKTYFRKSLNIPDDQILVLKDKDVKRWKFINKNGKPHSTLHEHMNKAKPEGVAWFVFVGHGFSLPVVQGSTNIQSEDEPALLMYDAEMNMEVLDDLSLRLSEVQEILNMGTQSTNVLVLDSCFSGLDQYGKNFQGSQSVLLERDLDKMTKPINPAKTQHVFSAVGATSKFARSLPTTSARPAFSYLMLASLQGAADLNKDKIIESHEISNFMRSFNFMSEQRPSYIGTTGASAFKLETKREGRSSEEFEVFKDCSIKGQLRTKKSEWKCCWPNQGWSNQRCMGPPVCPKIEERQFIADGEQCVDERAWKARDDDGDGKTNIEDQCPLEYAQTSNGCPSPLAHPHPTPLAPTVERTVVHQSTASTQGFRLIPANSFTMGSPKSEVGRHDDEGQTQVTLTRSFYMQETEVTQGQWRTLMGNNPSENATCGDSCPVEKISWYDALAYLNALSTSQGLEQCYVMSGCSGTPGLSYSCTQVTWKNGLDCRGYRLPTDAEWEYAARAGTTSSRYGNIRDIAWYSGNASKTRPVKGKLPNGWGLYDMLGNVWEWTWDAYANTRTGGEDPILGGTTLNGNGVRAGRGCDWSSNTNDCRFSRRGRGRSSQRSRSLGLRAARSAF